MGRPKLGNLLSEVDGARDTAPAPAPAQVPPHGSSAPSPSVDAAPSDGPAPEPTPPSPPATPRRRATAQTPPAGPKYLELVRKEARFTDAQLDELTIVTRRLNKSRKGAGERITDNTLIRVAVDLLLARQGDLAGDTEDALRKSVGL